MVTEKMDGENTTMTRDACYARSLNSGYHESRTWVRGLWGSIRHEIPRGMRLCGENLYAVHSIEYAALASYFMLFSVWEGDQCLSWEETEEWAALLGLDTVPVLYKGPWDGSQKNAAWLRDGAEGWVVRPSGSFTRTEFAHRVGKWVRPNHVVGTHWRARNVKKKR